MLKVFHVGLILAASLFNVACERQPAEAIVATKKFNIPANQNITYSKNDKVIRFVLDGKDKILITKIDKIKSESEIIRVTIADINADTYGHRNLWNRLKKMQTCKSKKFNDIEYEICEGKSSLAKSTEYQISRKGQKPHLVLTCDNYSKLPNPLCVADGLIIDQVGSHYTFNVQYLQDVLLINETIIGIVMDMSAQSGERNDDLYTDDGTKNTGSNLQK